MKKLEIPLLLLIRLMSLYMLSHMLFKGKLFSIDDVRKWEQDCAK